MKYDAGEIYVNLSIYFMICLHWAVFVTFSQKQIGFIGHLSKYLLECEVFQSHVIRKNEGFDTCLECF
jgi:hypothetical protein